MGAAAIGPDLEQHDLGNEARGVELDPAKLDLATIAAREGWSEQTLEATRSDLRAWMAYAGPLASLPVRGPLFVAWLAIQAAQGLAVSTLRRRASSIARLHSAAGLESPHSAHTRVMLRGFAEVETAPATPARRPVTIDLIRRAWAGLTARDRALLLLGSSLKLSRRVLGSLRWHQLTRGPIGWTLQLEQGGGVALMDPAVGSALDALADALASAPLDEQALAFGTGSTVSRVVKKAARLAGEDPRAYSARSLAATRSSGSAPAWLFGVADPPP